MLLSIVQVTAESALHSCMSLVRLFEVSIAVDDRRLIARTIQV